MQKLMELELELERSNVSSAVARASTFGIGMWEPRPGAPHRMHLVPIHDDHCSQEYAEVG